MCFSAGTDEAATINNLITLTLHALVADRLGVDIGMLRPEQDLVRDWRIDAGLAALIADDIDTLFDGLQIDPQEHRTLGDLTASLVAHYGVAV